MADSATDLAQERRIRRAARVTELLMRLTTQAVQEGDDAILDMADEALTRLRERQMVQGSTAGQSQLAQAVALAQELAED